MAFEQKYMQRAIELAKKGVGAVNPNPMVGAVIVKNDRIIGEGYHRKYGQLHAERDAFENLTEDASGAEMYVTLEPCCHYGKQPPCVHAIVEHKIKTVYVGSDDPNEKVSGKGYQYLREHGINVVTHMMKEECDELNEVFFHYITTKKPYVVLKYAMTLDGKIASFSGKSRWISNENSRKKVQELRNRLMGIMVGIGTVLKDNPMLNCRIDGGNNPTRIICDTRLRIPLDCNICETAADIPTIVVCGMECALDEAGKTKKELLKEKGIRIIEVPTKNGVIDLEKLMTILGEQMIDSILLEGGGELNFSAVEAGIVDELIVFVAPKVLGGKEAVNAVGGRGFESPDEAARFSLKSIEHIDDDICLKYLKVKEV